MPSGLPNRAATKSECYSYELASRDTDQMGAIALAAAQAYQAVFSVNKPVIAIAS